MKRDIEIIRWLNGWGFSTVEKIAIRMDVGFSTAARRMSLLVEEGLLERVVIPLVKVSPLIPTPKGCRVAEDGLVPLGGIRLGTFRHDMLLVDVARKIANRYGGEIEPGRRVRHSLGADEPRHIPDAVLHRDNQRPTAIELELTVKSRTRLQAIVNGYAADMRWGSVWYVTDNAEVVRAVNRASGNNGFIKVATIEPASPPKPTEG